MFSAKDLLGPQVGFPSTKSERPRPLLAAAVIAVASALLVYVAARSVSGPLVVDGARGRTEVPAGAVVLATVFGAASAWFIARLAARSTRPRPVAACLFGAGLVLSSVPPVLGATTASTTTWLLLMHLVVAVPLVAAAWRLLNSRPANGRPADSRPASGLTAS
jgi:hypothetical protein